MRILLIIGIIILGYWIFVKPKSPTAATSAIPAATASATPPAAQPSKPPISLKAPMDRARNVLEKVDKQNKAEGY